MRAPHFRLLLVLCSVLTGQVVAASSMEVSGPAIIIIDGDTLWVGLHEVRNHGIDAPETAQKCQLPKGTWDCSEATIMSLMGITMDQTVRCEGNERDDSRRLIARCSTDEVPDFGAQLVASGLAWAFVKYSTDYSELERWPRGWKIGVWQSKTQPPWVYRARRWKVAEQKAPNGCPIKGNISKPKREKIYHTPWSRHYTRTMVDPSKGDRWFCSEAEAKAAGWRAPYR